MRLMLFAAAAPAAAASGIPHTIVYPLSSSLNGDSGKGVEIES